MKQIFAVFALLLSLPCSKPAPACDKFAPAQTGMAAPQQHADQAAAALDAQREKRALMVFLKVVQKQIASAADATACPRSPRLRMRAERIAGSSSTISTKGTTRI